MNTVFKPFFAYNTLKINHVHPVHVNRMNKKANPSSASLICTHNCSKGSNKATIALKSFVLLKVYFIAASSQTSLAELLFVLNSLPEKESQATIRMEKNICFAIF